MHQERHNCLAFLAWIFLSTLMNPANGCPPPDLFQPCECEVGTTINCDNVTSSEQLADVLEQEFGTSDTFERILINYTPIISIPSNVFQFIKVKTFRMTNNKELWFFGEDAFEGSQDTAESVLLMNNSISDDLIFDAISKLKQVKEVNLERNKLETIPDKAFANLQNLRTVKIYYNQITSVGNSAFANLTRLEVIDLRHNKLTSIGSYAFFNLPQLYDLVLFENRVEKVGDYAFALGPKSHSRESTVVWLNGNELNTFWPKAFEGLGRNALVHLFRNRFTTLPKDLFVSLLDQFHSLNSNEFFSKGFADFGGNEFICDCKVKWMLEERKYLRYAVGIVCVETGRALLTYNETAIKDCNFK